MPPRHRRGCTRTSGAGTGACIAMGYATWNQARAEQELRSLFSGQWRNGQLPHIVFTDRGRYFPGPDSGRPSGSADAPAQPPTSGIVQPPIHATAAWQVYLRGPRSRTRQGVPRGPCSPQPRAHGTSTSTASVCRNGETDSSRSGTRGSPGMDNSPVWDEALEADRVDIQVQASRAYRARRRTSIAERGGTSVGRGIRPLRLSRRAVPRPWPTIRRRSARPCHSRSSPCSSTRCSCGRTRTWPRSPASGRRRPGAVRDLGDAPPPPALERLWDDEACDLRRPRRTWRSERVGVADGWGLAPLYAGVPDADRARAHGRASSRDHA